MPFMQAAFAYTVQLAIGCVHTPLSVFLMCVYKFKVMPHHQKFSSYTPEPLLISQPLHAAFFAWAAPFLQFGLDKVFLCDIIALSSI